MAVRLGILLLMQKSIMYEKVHLLGKQDTFSGHPFILSSFDSNMKFAFDKQRECLNCSFLLFRRYR
jgi:hypothetical protein